MAEKFTSTQRIKIAQKIAQFEKWCEINTFHSKRYLDESVIAYQKRLSLLKRIFFLGHMEMEIDESQTTDEIKQQLKTIGEFIRTELI